MSWRPGHEDSYPFDDHGLFRGLVGDHCPLCCVPRLGVVTVGFLCRIGIHRWRHINAPMVIPGFMERICLRCGKTVYHPGLS